ncbi:spike base protein, RCAP_Rcc01079 family [Sphingomonas bacterium]|uniref:spike base protein, RCAP_Rcc01079 family n=1 Tax=Sphingomonas bacterium TaxID=1895847 RepID=UPI001C2D7D5B|nr:hypothetical protein [Sphingomonas bacterium]
MTDATTPVPANTPIGDLIGGKLHGRDQLFDTTGTDAMGLVADAPAPRTLLGRLKALLDVFSRTTSATDVLAVVPSDTVPLAVAPKALLVTVAGNLALKGASGVAITIPVTAGQLLPVQPVYVLAAGTTATVVALV